MKRKGGKKKQEQQERILTNYILEYWELIKYKFFNGNWRDTEYGEIIVNIKIYKTYKKIVEDLYDEDSVWEFDIKRAQHAIDFIEKYCRHSKGAMGGKPFKMTLWQKAMVSIVFGFVHKIDGIRKYKEFILIIARKNGKSMLASALALYIMIADQEAGAEVYAVATKKDQAKVVWDESKRIVNKSKKLKEKISIKKGTNELLSDFNDSVFKPLSSDSNTLDGLNVHGALLDEIHAWKDKELYDVIVDGMSAREQPLTIITTTAGFIRESIYDIKYDEIERIIDGYSDPEGYKEDRTIAFVYELDGREEWTNPEMWVKSNPGLDVIKDKEELARKVHKAKANPLLVKNLLTKDFNIPETGTQAWLTLEQAENRATFDIRELKPRYGIGGVDLASNVDLCSACVLFRVPNDPIIYYKHMYWLPEDVLEKRVAEDKVPYDIWRDLGLLRVTPGNTVDTQFVVDWFLELQDEEDIYMYKIGYDRWGSKLFVNQMETAFGKNTLVQIAQGAQTLSAPMKNIEVQLESKMINYNNNTITKWCLTNTAVEIDKNDNIKPKKTSNPRKRIDGFASMLDAYVVYLDDTENYLNII